jgi:hypothetical protein
MAHQPDGAIRLSIEQELDALAWTQPNPALAHWPLQQAAIRANDNEVASVVTA